MNRIKFIDWGIIDYQQAWQNQENLLLSMHKEHQKDDFFGYLIFCEHPHVFTLGRSAKKSNMLLSEEMLQKVGATLIQTNRGGDITYHGPGQLVGYPVVHLDKLKLGIKSYVYLLEETIIRSLAEYGINSTRLAGATGVWIIPENGMEKKICAMGIRCSRSVTMHGFALNVSTDLSFFNYINPCGFTDKGVTSLNEEITSTPDMESVKKVVLKNFLLIFGLQLEDSVYSNE